MRDEAMTIEKQLADALRDALDELKRSHPVPHDGMIAMANTLAAYDAHPVAGDEQVEAVARAIYEAGIPKGGRDYVAWDDLDSDGFYAQHDLAMKQASAAIAALQPQVSPELIDKLGKLANYLTEQGEYEACDLIDTVVERVTKPALQPQGDGLAELRALSEREPKNWEAANGDIWCADHDQHGEPVQVLLAQTEPDRAAFIVAMERYVRAKIERTKG